MSEIAHWPATRLRRAIDQRHVSCVEVMQAYLDRIAARNMLANAIVSLQDEDALLRQAAERDRSLAEGRSLGLLHGFPQAIKNLQPAAGLPFTEGSPIYAARIATADSIMVGRMRSAGAIFIGKTNTPELGLGSHSDNPVHGPTANAFDASRSAGGSSGGAAVAVALHMLPVADGSDYCGSLRNPPGWNNVYGFRPGSGLVPRDGDVWMPPMGALGPIARNVPDLALLLAVQAGRDPRAPLSRDEDPSVFARLEPAPRSRRPRVAWCGDFGGAIPIEPEVLQLCGSAMRVFEAIGCDVEPAFPDFDYGALWAAFMRLRAWQEGATLRAAYDDPETRRRLAPEALFEVEQGMRLRAFDVTDASAFRTLWFHRLRLFFESYDFIAAPTAQLFPFAIEARSASTVAGHVMSTYHEWMKIAVPATMAGSPVLALPAGFGQAGLPVGIQLIGPARSDLACLRLGLDYDQATRWEEKLPD